MFAGVRLSGFIARVLSLHAVATSSVCMVSRLFMIPGFVAFGRFFVMLGSFLQMLGSFSAHMISPLVELISAHFTTRFCNSSFAKYFVCHKAEPGISNLFQTLARAVASPSM